MNRRLLSVVIWLLISAIGCIGQEKPMGVPELSSAGQKAFETLLTAERFENTNIGYGGDPSKLVKAYRQILDEPNRITVLKLLTEKATKPGQLYGLVGLFDADYQYFLSILDRFKNDHSQVDVISGCVLEKIEVADVVFRDDPKTIRLETPYQPFSDWAHKANATSGFYVDIAGGGYSLMFRGHDLQRPN